MAVTFDANAAADTSGSAILGTTGVSGTNLTVGSGSNRVLVVCLVFSNQSVTSVVVNWDNAGTPQAMTLIKSANGTGTTARAELWGLVNPTAGAKTLKVTWNAVNSDVYMNGTSWTGADQTGGTTTFPHSTSATGTTVANGFTVWPSPAPLVVTSAVNNATMVAASIDLGSLSTPTQTQTFLDSAFTVDGAGARAAGAATVSFNWSSDVAAGHWVMVGTDIAVPGAFPPFRAPQQAVYRM